MNTPSLLASLKSAPNNPVLLNTLQAIDAEDFSRIIRITEKHQIADGKAITLSPEEVTLGLKQYYGLIALSPVGTEYAISGALDPYWHTHVLDTQEYSAFCKRGPGRFIHHVPLDDDDRTEYDRVAGVYLKTGEDLRKTFVSVSDKIFPPNADPENVICTMFWGD
jgi:hypothetical protein